MLVFLPVLCTNLENNIFTDILFPVLQLYMHFAYRYANVCECCVSRHVEPCVDEPSTLDVSSPTRSGLLMLVELHLNPGYRASLQFLGLGQTLRSAFVCSCFLRFFLLRGVVWGGWQPFVWSSRSWYALVLFCFIGLLF